ncbi:MAG TPA: type II toxin-antitoxin system prevent-host-death family antitoxin [Verrucomicrobiae bacterium]|nr:type II toxin-antitoxin system prevent-host-death family antitoxin [Verrucomicrobiae bacterium]
MASVTALEAKTRFGELLDRVARGEEIVITRHEKAVARIVPEGRASLAGVRSAVAGVRELREKIAARKGKLTLAELKSAVAEGRK